MSRQSRRAFLKKAGALAATPALLLRSRASAQISNVGVGVRIESVTMAFEEHRYRAPYKFGGVPVDRATILNVNAKVKTGSGKLVEGFGSMPLGNVWSFPSREMSYETTLGAMKVLAERICRVTGEYREAGHPIELNFRLEPEYLRLAAAVSAELGLKQSIPKLCTLVTASAFDAALHDAYGKALGRSAYDILARDLVGRDLSRYLTKDFRGESLQSYVERKPRRRISMFHSAGGVDAVFPSEVQQKLDDGLPETLAEWIRFNGLTHIKIKLQGEDLRWDVERTVNIDRVASETRADIDWKYCVDFNERCPNVGYVLEYLRKVREQTPRGFDRILYLEQPTARDLRASRENSMREAARLRPVVIDESLTDLDSLRLARELGYTGVALKACKGQSQAMLMAAAAQKYKMFLCVQDLTCPGASLIHSAGIASHVPGVSGIEANSRQYMPAANERWRETHPGIFEVKDGSFDTSHLDRPGLSAV